MEPDLEDRPLSAGLLTSRLSVLTCKMGESHTIGSVWSQVVSEWNQGVLSTVPGMEKTLVK